MYDAIVSGLVLGLSAGLSPGPLMALVLAQTIEHGVKEGCKTALAPLITDAPVIAASLFVTTQLSRIHWFLSFISFAGGIYVAWLAWKSFFPPEIAESTGKSEPKTWSKAFFTNILSPNPWLFWFTVGAATVLKAKASGWIDVALFLLLFYGLLCGSKALLAVIAGQARPYLGGKLHILVLRLLAVTLAMFAILLFRDGFKYCS